jgi:hypothetical protein
MEVFDDFMERTYDLCIHDQETASPSTANSAGLSVSSSSIIAANPHAPMSVPVMQFPAWSDQ